MTTHYFRKTNNLQHNLKIKVKETNTAQIYCEEHGIAVAEFNNDQLMVLGGTCMREGGQSDTIELDRKGEFEPLHETMEK